MNERRGLLKIEEPKTTSSPNRSTPMRVVYIKGQEVDAVKPVRARKPTAKQIQEERVLRLIYRMEMNDYRRVLREYADRIAEIKKHIPDFELPPPTMEDVRFRFF